MPDVKRGLISESFFMNKEIHIFFSMKCQLTEKKIFFGCSSATQKNKLCVSFELCRRCLLSEEQYLGFRLFILFAGTKYRDINPLSLKGT